MRPAWSVTSDGVRLTVKVSPRARRTESAGMVDLSGEQRALSLRLAAPPVDGAANEALCTYLAGELGIAKSAVSIRSGAGSRIKQVDLSGDSIMLVESLRKLAV